MSEQHKQVAMKFIEAMGQGDAATAATCLAPNARAVAKNFSKLAGTRTREQMLGGIEAFKTLIPKGFQPTFNTVTADGDRVAVEWEGNAVSANGKPYCNQYCMVFTFQGGKISNLNEYFCSKLADDVLYPQVATIGQALLEKV